MIETSNTTFTESQRLRMRSILSLKEAGEQFAAIRDALSEASLVNPIETDLGTFTSFNHFLTDQGFNRASIYQYIKLYENWNIVVKLGMQDDSNTRGLEKAMRLSRTLKIIDWYNAKLNLGYPEESLTLDLYWEETEGTHATGPTKRQLQEQLDAANLRIALLESELAELKQRVEPPRPHSFDRYRLQPIGAT